MNMKVKQSQDNKKNNCFHYHIFFISKHQSKENWKTYLDRDSTVVQQMSETEENIDVANVDNNAIPNLLPGKSIVILFQLFSYIPLFKGEKFCIIKL